jgi:prephenate dehydrogenase
VTTAEHVEDTRDGGHRGVGVVGVVGLGLIGGSIALDLLAGGVEVVALDPDPTTREAAKRVGITVADDLAAVAEHADVVVVATPAGVVADLVGDLVTLTTAPVTDVASVRDPAALGMGPDLPATWVGSHPMAGTERSTFQAARRGLLVGAPWLLTPHDDVDMGALAAVAELALALQTRPIVVAPDVHDTMVATVSHLPHLLAFALQQRGRAVGGDVVAALAGPSYRDATRVAASSPEFWADLVGRNHDAVAAALAELQGWLDDTMTTAATDQAALAARFEAARRRPGPRLQGDDADEDIALGDRTGALDRLRAAGRHGRHVTRIATVSGVTTLSISPPTAR